MQLYSYWRSTAAYRVRIALNLKGIDCEIVPIDLVKDGGQQHQDDYVALNPAHLVPSLKLDDGEVLTQSLAIIDYLEQLQPEPSLLSAEPILRAKIMAVAHVVAMDIHPVNNLRVVQHLGAEFDADAKAKQQWMLYWMKKGFDAVETLIAGDADFAFGNEPSLADICIVAQCYNAHRWGLDMSAYKRIVEIEKNCLKLESFVKAVPENQIDAVVN